MDVCVLGAGIVGLSTAYVLSSQGHRVTVLDRAAVGAGASGGNGAQLSYSYVQPLADASIWAQLPRLLLSKDSPLTFRPQLDLQQWRWGVAFLRACNSTTSASSTASLLALAAQSRSSFERMMADETIDCDYSSSGKLVIYPDGASLAAAQRQMALQSTLGSQQYALSASETIKLEPSLANYNAHIAGAIHTPSECAVDCLLLCQGLERALRALGVLFVLNTQINSLALRAGQVVAVDTAQGAIQAHYFVMALGNDSVALARSVGVHLPIYPIKGYSITLGVGQAPAHAAPMISVTDAARKVVYARMGQRLRVAGMAQLVGNDRSVQPAAIASLERSTQALFPQLVDCPVQSPWAGLRPATPTGLPIIGVSHSGPGNLIMNTGHGALGLTLAFGTAERVARLVPHSPARQASHTASVIKAATA